MSTTSASYPLAVAFSILSVLVALLAVPPLLLHISHSNVGASTLIALTQVANLQIALNAALWPHDEFRTWPSGVGVCDVQVKLQPVMALAFPAALWCVLRGLARALDQRNLQWDATQQRTRRWRGMLVDGLICGVLPWVQVLSAWVVQPVRFYVFGISGCEAAVDGSWLVAVLLLAPRFAWTMVDIWYAVLILHRLRLHRRTLASILQSHRITTSRFLRLYALCLCATLIMFPLELYLDVTTIFATSPAGRLTLTLTPFSWSTTHHPTSYDWNSAILVQSKGRILPDRYIWLGGGVLVFLLFGCGTEAGKMYRRAFSVMGSAGILERSSNRQARSRDGSSRRSILSGVGIKTIGALASKTKSQASSSSPSLSSASMA